MASLQAIDGPSRHVKEPHNLAPLLQPPSPASTRDHVLHHINSLLPELSLNSPHAASSSLPSASVLRAHLQSARCNQIAASTQKSETEEQLRTKLISSLNTVKALKAHLESLPDGIADTEDLLLDLCEQLATRDTSSTPESSSDASRSLIQRLQQLHIAIDNLKQAKAYFAILANAQNLRLEIIKLDAGTGTNNDSSFSVSLQRLGQLCALVQQCERLCPTSASSQVKAIQFLIAQRDAAFSALKNSRLARLQSALAQSGWPPKSSPDDPSHDADLSPSHIHANPSAAFAQSSTVRQAWHDLCQLQDSAEKLALLPPATAKPIKSSSSRSKSQEPQPPRPCPGSDAYVPLLATSALIEPLLLRFRFHFDGSRPTNRLDKPEWYLSHVAALIRSQASIFLPAIHRVAGSGGPVARLCRTYSNSRPDESFRKPYRNIDTHAELLHGLLVPLRRKLASSMPVLLEHPSLLAHTVFQALTFDADLREQFPTSLSVIDGVGATKIADEILNNPDWFDKWLHGERDFALKRFESIMDSPDAWAIGSSDSIAEDDEQVFSVLSSDPASSSRLSDGALKTTKSARAVIDILESVTERYRPLPSLSQRLSFLAIVQLPILRAYFHRLQKSLDAFESLSSAFARAMPGELSAGIGAATGVTTSSSDSDMVRGLRGLGRLVKAMLSALFICEELERWADTAFFVEMSEDLGSTEEGKKLALGLKQDDQDAQDRELDAASLGTLLRRGLKRGAAGVRPLSSATGSDPLQSSQLDVADGQQPLLTDFGRYGVWEEPRRKFGEVVSRASHGLERLVISEVLEQLRPYSLRRWDEGDGTEPQEQGPNEEVEPDTQGLGGRSDIPTPTLIPSLSLLSTHLSHLVSILDSNRLIPIYRRIASSVSSALIERVVMAGKCHTLRNFSRICFTS